MKITPIVSRHGISRRSLLISSGAIGLSTIAPKVVFADTGAGDALLKRLISVDTHSHPGPFYLRNEGMGLARAALDKIKASPLTAFTYSVVSDSANNDNNPYWYTMSELKSAAGLLETAKIAVARQAEDIAAAKREGRKVCLLAVEGADFANDRLSALAEVHQLGVRIVQPVHNTANDFAVPQTLDYRADLKPAGKDLIKELNRLGMIIDVAHLSAKGVVTVAEESSSPILLSHALHIPKRLRRHSPTKGITGRITQDFHRKAVVGTGGVIGVWNLNHTPKRSDLHEVFGYDSGKQFFVDTFKWLAEEYGVDHVALGSDLDSTDGWFKGYDQLPGLVEELSLAGFNDREIGKMLGGNFLRIFSAAAKGGPRRTDKNKSNFINDRLVGNTISYRLRNGRQFANYLAEGGKSLYVSPSGREVKKKWWVEAEDILCRTVGRRDNERNICFKVSAGGSPDHVTLSRKNGTSLYQAKILKGKQISQ